MACQDRLYLKRSIGYLKRGKNLISFHFSYIFVRLISK
ncbi:hypothetical protein SD77_3995 [Bacillus badius]|uniref:Ribose 5-phosphate isomerase B n=1 Tax=Bacillus badius TaxID=1455 RepID=A0ABR5AUM6_BACBA|nr:hypothetical protein SD78_0853 [Bacillus badius]KIL78315.1 hypothetical protein SD77_3995 [Bacillus badius]